MLEYCYYDTSKQMFVRFHQNKTISIGENDFEIIVYKMHAILYLSQYANSSPSSVAYMP